MTSPETLCVPPELVWVKQIARVSEYDYYRNMEFMGWGKLRDSVGMVTAFRAFLSASPTSLLMRFATNCMDCGPPYAWQDIVNEVGRRFGFEVEHGPYQGRKGNPGYDGLWTLPHERTFMIEVTSGDSLVPDIEAFAGYRQALVADGRIPEKKSSILFVAHLGMQGLAEDVRLSRHRRYMSVSSAWPLLSLMLLRDASDNPPTTRWIGHVLNAYESANVDETLARMLSADELSRCRALASEQIEEAPDDGIAAADDPNEDAAFYRACVSCLSSRECAVLIQQDLPQFISRDGRVEATVYLSKNYGDRHVAHFWFSGSICPIGRAERNFVVLVCGSKDDLLAIPHAVLGPLLDMDDNIWLPGSRSVLRFWHLHIVRQEERFWIIREDAPSQEVTEYVL